MVNTAWLRERMVGCVYGSLAGRRFSYLMGGTLRLDSEDLKVGHFTHWTAMREARDLGMDGYDFTSGGPPGVMRFKMGFNPVHIPLFGPRHVVIRPFQAKLLNSLFPMIRKRKRQAAALASRLVSGPGGR